MKVFISHASEDKAIVSSIAASLPETPLESWVDFTDIRPGALLTPQIQEAIRDSRALLLCWSKAACRSPWVNTEWLTAFHEGRYIIPCVLDSTPLPPCFRNVLFLTRKDLIESPTVLVTAIDRAQPGKSEISAAPRPAWSEELLLQINRIIDQQELVLGQLGKVSSERIKASQLQADKLMRAALQRWPEQPFILVLDGYHLKNHYQIKHWSSIQAGMLPEDQLLEEARSRFFQALFLDPNDHRALNGLSNFFLFQNEVEAAEFFNRHAIQICEKQGEECDAYENDRRIIQHKLPSKSMSSFWDLQKPGLENLSAEFGSMMDSASAKGDMEQASRAGEILQGLESILGEMSVIVNEELVVAVTGLVESAQARLSEDDRTSLSNFVDQLRAGNESAIDLASRLQKQAITLDDLVLLLRYKQEA